MVGTESVRAMPAGITGEASRSEQAINARARSCSAAAFSFKDEVCSGVGRALYTAKIIDVRNGGCERVR